MKFIGENQVEKLGNPVSNNIFINCSIELCCYLTTYSYVGLSYIVFIMFIHLHICHFGCTDVVVRWIEMNVTSYAMPLTNL